MTSDRLSLSSWSDSILGIDLKYSTYCSSALPAETNTQSPFIVVHGVRSWNPNVAIIGGKNKPSQADCGNAPSETTSTLSLCCSLRAKWTVGPLCNCRALTVRRPNSANDQAWANKLHETDTEQRADTVLSHGILVSFNIYCIHSQGKMEQLISIFLALLHITSSGDFGCNAAR